MNIAVVVPTIREDCLKRWQDEWADDLAGARVIIVEDNPERTFAVTGGAEHYCWADFAELGEDAWIIPRRTSACRSYGYWKAWQGGAGIIWTLDDDCYPEDARRGSYLAALEKILRSDRSQGGWVNTLPAEHGKYPRGFPYAIREQRRPVMLHHGLWSGVPDFDGLTQQADPDFRLPPAQDVSVLPCGPFFPMCVMNLAFRADLAPASYLLLMGQDGQGGRWGFDRFDDMWAGLFVKRICDHLGWAVTSGAPSIRHSKASRAEDNIRLEAAGIAAHEDFWPYVRGIPLTATTAGACYRELARAVAGFGSGYWPKLATAMAIWTALFEEGGRPSRT